MLKNPFWRLRNVRRNFQNLGTRLFLEMSTSVRFHFLEITPPINFPKILMLSNELPASKFGMERWTSLGGKIDGTLGWFGLVSITSSCLQNTHSLVSETNSRSCQLRIDFYRGWVRSATASRKCTNIYIPKYFMAVRKILLYF